MCANVFFLDRYLSGILCKKKDWRYSFKCTRTAQTHTMTSVKELVINKYLQNQTCGSIFRDLSKFNVQQNFVYQTVKRYIENGSSGKRKYTTRKRSVTTQLVVKKIRERIRRKCYISARKLAANLKLNRETVRLVLKNYLQLSAYKKKISWTYECNCGEAFQTCENSAKLARG
jgi:transposase